MKKKNNLKDEKMKNMKKGAKNIEMKNNSNNHKKNEHANSALKKENKNKESLKEEMKVNVQEQLNLNETKEIVNEKEVKVKESKQSKNESNETRKEKPKMSKEKKNKIVKTVLIIAGVIALFGLVFFASTTRDTKKSVNYVEDITASKYFELKNGEEKAVILLASPGCSWCQKYRPVINKMSSDYELPIYYLNVGSLATEDYNSVYASSPAVNKSGTGYISTPTTLLVSKGEEIDYIEGYVEYNTLLNFLTSNGVIN